MRRLGWPAALLTAALGAIGPIGSAAQPSSAEPVIVGSKAFTESVILGEIVVRTLEQKGIPAEHRRALGGSRVLFDALRAGEIDLYPEYTGTLDEELLGSPDSHGSGGDTTGAAGSHEAQSAAARSRAAALQRLGLTIVARFGFEDRYVLGMLPDTARRLGIRRISDLARSPGLHFGFSNEFMNRADGWPGLERAYALGSASVQGLDHELAYRALEHGDIDVTDLYSTDPEIVRDRLTVLEDDRGFFPDYSALLLARATLPAEVRGALASLSGRIDTQTMARMNERVLIGHLPESEVAEQFVSRLTGGSIQPAGRNRLQELGRYTLEQLALTCASLAAAILIGLPLGILAARRPALARLVLGAAGVVQTIPSLALLVFMIPLLGIGFAPAALALFLYSLLPVIRGTCAGLGGIPRPLIESAAALGLTDAARLRLIELPLAARSILAGIKTAAVINIGTATLGALIGAGGYGQPILTGIRLNDVGLILEGAIPAALLALAVQGLFDAIERLVLNPSTFSRSKR